jgi:hypothetical protein
MKLRVPTMVLHGYQQEQHSEHTSYFVSCSLISTVTPSQHDILGLLRILSLIYLNVI